MPFSKCPSVLSKQRAPTTVNVVGCGVYFHPVGKEEPGLSSFAWNLAWGGDSGEDKRKVLRGKEQISCPFGKQKVIVQLICSQSSWHWVLWKQLQKS